MKKLLLFLSLVLVLTGCGSRETVVPPPAPEDQLVIWTPLDETIYGPLTREFEARSGLWVRVEQGGERELLDRLDEGGCDLLLGFSSTLLSEYRDRLSPMEISLPETTPGSFRDPDGFWIPFSSQTVVLIYNPVLVRMNPPCGFQDLLDPAWQGAVSFADPAVSEAAFLQMSTMLLSLGRSPLEVLTAFRANLRDPVPDPAQAVKQVADGTAYIGLAMAEDAQRAIQNGWDLAIVSPSEGSCIIPLALGLPENGSHPESALAFTSFVLERDVQKELLQSSGMNPIRWDVRVPRSDLHLLDFLPGDAADQRSRLLELWEVAG